MVGLPARGKTYIAQRISQYLNWLGIQTRTFNVGNYRRRISGAQQPHAFFDSANERAEAERAMAAQMAMDDLLEWLGVADPQGRVAIYDATNSRRGRRAMILEACRQRGYEAMFVESLCTDPAIIETNIRQVKLNSPDYRNMGADEAVRDFCSRIAHYEAVYEPVDSQPNYGESLLSYVKLINVGAQAILNNIHTYQQSRIIFLLLNLHILPRNIYLCRHGETDFNLAGRIGGDGELSEGGRAFAQTLPSIMAGLLNAGEELNVWTSTLKRTIETASLLPHPQVAWKALDEIDAGVCDGLTYEEIAQCYPQEFAARDLDKLFYRYRGGESYADLILRLEPVIMELERHRNVMIVGHQAVLRAILGYFLATPRHEMPYLQVPLHTILKLTPGAYGCEMEMIKVPIPAVNTHRSQPALK